MITRSEIFDMNAAGSPLSGLAAQAVEHLSGLRELAKFYETLPRDSDESFLEVVRRELGLACDVTAGDLARIPRSGPVVVVANHPFGAAEGIVLARVLGIVRNDVRLLANQLLGRIPELRDNLILVDPFHPGASRPNVSGLRRAIAHVARGGMLATFPAGAVSHLQLEKMTVVDPEWNVAIARLVRRTKATVLPVYFPGTNGPLFQLAGLLHPNLSTALLAHALLDRRHTRIEMRIGRPIAFSRIAHLQSDEEMIVHLRRRTYLLANRTCTGVAQPRPNRKGAMIAPAHPGEALAREVDALPSSALLVSSGELDVLLATPERIPILLREIGRLREITFRAAGEGSGNAVDLDAFDAFYSHLFLWNRAKRELAGAYRLGVVDPIVRRYGISGLYTSTLFRYSPAFFKALGAHAVEMGRSWVAAEYQKSYSPLLLLWKGIATFVARNPESCVLFGPASISNDYAPSSRALMARYLLDAVAAKELMPHVAPRAPFRAARNLEPASDFEELQELLQEIENGQRALPVLLRQYLNVGGRVAALNVDRQFSDVLDALVVVDLRATPEKMLARYMTPDGARTFLEHHGTS
ncbi:MAG TPA: lysophospholipid acyltransferase family protein [Thermoanaerobaculia bacterium]|jgi:putative hemolysin|nr:lysophospholipid acyltransferase family protein [Thermoanaerobaculia bacterium]